MSKYLSARSVRHMVRYNQFDSVRIVSVKGV